MFLNMVFLMKKNGSMVKEGSSLVEKQTADSFSDTADMNNMCDFTVSKFLTTINKINVLNQIQLKAPMIIVVRIITNKLK